MKIENGVLTNVTKEDLMNGILDIPVGVKKIGDLACFDLLELKYVTFPRPNTVKEIGEGAFCNCANLDFINIPEGTEKIGARAFCRCTSLTSVFFGESLKYVGESAFERCYMLGLAVLENVEQIKASCFKDCATLKDVYIKNAKEIPAKCFENCTHLEKVIISPNVIKIGEKAFYECSSLKNVFFEPIKNVKNYTQGLQKIGDHAFGWCTRLEEIEIPETVLEIGAWAFKGCKSLKKIKTAIGSEKFNFCKLDNSANVEIIK